MHVNDLDPHRIRVSINNGTAPAVENKGRAMLPPIRQRRSLDLHLGLPRRNDSSRLRAADTSVEIIEP